MQRALSRVNSHTGELQTMQDMEVAMQAVRRKLDLAMDRVQEAMRCWLGKGSGSRESSEMLPSGVRVTLHCCSEALAQEGPRDARAHETQHTAMAARPRVAAAGCHERCRRPRLARRPLDETHSRRRWATRRRCHWMAHPRGARMVLLAEVSRLVGSRAAEG